MYSSKGIIIVTQVTKVKMIAFDREMYLFEETMLFLWHR